MLKFVPFVVVGIVMFIVVFQIGEIMDADIFTLIFQLVTGIFIYGVGVLLLVLKRRTELMVLLKKNIVK